MLAWYLLHTSGDLTKLAATLPALRATALCWPCRPLLKPDILGDCEGSHELFSASHTPWPQPAQGQNHKSHFTDERREAQRGGPFTVQSPNYIPTTLVPQLFPNPSEQPRPFTMCCSHTTTCGDSDGGCPLLPLLLLCALAAECVIFVPSSEAVSCIPLCGLSSAISTFRHI